MRLPKRLSWRQFLHWELRRPIRKRRKLQRRQQPCPAWNSYNGHRVRRHGQHIERVQAASLTARQFFKRYVRTRRPVVLLGLADFCPELGSACAQWTDQFLQAAAGEQTVEVERRSPEGRFGMGNIVTVPFGQFLKGLAAGDSMHYMATQTLPVDAEGRPGLMAAPVKQLHAMGNVPLQPALLGNLIPMNLNLWMGNSRDGASSGLHHDYHDNLYVLLRGAKRFRLYSPADAHKMHTVGKMTKVHPNGRINYRGCLTGADGATEGAQEAMAAEQALEGIADMDDDMDDEFEAALQAVLDAEGDQLSVECDDDDDCFSNDPRPVNFSQVDPAKPDRTKFCQFGDAKAAFCELKAGEMLWLPAGWFHEVTSWSGKTVPDCAGHMALNYWCHPADGESFTQPYKSQFWPNDWDRRE